MSTAAVNGTVVVPHSVHDHQSDGAIDEDDQRRRLDRSARRMRKMVTLPKIQAVSSYPKLSDFVASTNDDLRQSQMRVQNQLTSSDRSLMNATYTTANGSLAKELAAARARNFKHDVQFDFALPGAIMDHRRTYSLDRYMSKPRVIRNGVNGNTSKSDHSNYRLVSEPITRPESRQARPPAVTQNGRLNAQSLSVIPSGERPWSDRLPSIHRTNNSVRAKNGLLTNGLG